MRAENLRLIGVPLLLWFALGCTPVLLPEEPIEPANKLSDPGTADLVESFSGVRAWVHLKALTEIGGRDAGSAGNDRARKYIRSELESMGFEVESWVADYPDSEVESAENGDPMVVITNLSVRIPGTESDDRFVLVAPFDSQYFADFEFVGANDGASGAAVILEMARVLAVRPLAFTTEVVFVDGEAPFSLGNASSEAENFFEAVGREALALRIQEAGASGVRMMVYLNRVGDADLEIARDLMSHRVYREVFWEIAQDLGRTDVFRPGAAFEDAGVAHASLDRSGFRGVVSIVGTSHIGNQEADENSGSKEDVLESCSVESLRSVGFVSLGALHSISRRLAKIDRFARMPEIDSEAGAVPKKIVDVKEDLDVKEVAEAQQDPQAETPIDPAKSSWEGEPEFATDTRDLPASDEEEAAP